MSKYTRENKLITIIIVAFITLIAVVYSSNVSDKDLKKQVADQKANNSYIVNELKEIANTPSDIEILESYANSAAVNAGRYLEEIDSNKRYIESVQEEIVFLTGKYELSELRKRCNVEQMARKAQGLEYDIEYCLEDENVEQFRTKKY